MDYACFMSHLVSSVLIRSTSGTSEPRYRHASGILRNLAGEPQHINWLRSSADSKNLRDSSRNLFEVSAPYGAGIKNYIAHLRFNIFVFRMLWRIKPDIIYACDLDTYLPSFLYKIFQPAILIYDQFDPLSARVDNSLLCHFLNTVENTLTKKADIRITANSQRIPSSLRESWIEIKNLFPIKLSANKLRDSQNTFQLFYGGILNRDRALFECLTVIQKKSGWRIDIFGQGPERSELEKVSGANIGIHNQLPHTELMQRAQKADLYLAQYDPSSRNNRQTASNKLFEAAQLGVPLLTSKGTYLGDIVQKFNLGWAVTYGDFKEIERALDEYASLSKVQRVELIDNLESFFRHEIKAQNSEIIVLENRITNMMKSRAK
jgi:glycosyltransferase involved in cell wall biosynthesis